MFTRLGPPDDHWAFCARAAGHLHAGASVLISAVPRIIVGPLIPDTLHCLLHPRPASQIKCQ